MQSNLYFRHVSLKPSSYEWLKITARVFSSAELINIDFVNDLALLCHGPLSKKKKAKAKKAGNG